MNNKQQTAVEWQLDQLSSENLLSNFTYDQATRIMEIIEESKEIHKEQMWEYIKKNYCIGPKSLEFHRLEFEKYYNETYGGNK